MARPTIAKLRARLKRPAQAARGMLRRLTVTDTGTSSAAWSVAGGSDGDGNADSDSAEAFGTAGVMSRPTGRPEAILARLGGEGHTVILAARDQGWAASIGASGMADGECWLFNAQTFIRITADGEVWIARKDGELERVCTESHVHGPGTFANGGGAVAGFSAGASPSPSGGAGISSTLRAEKT